ncbi:MAG TPA: bifunctional tetrahydrofolate synthase/dihydrofolate synthase [Rhodanobacteraceae bacterium]|nr:bifunctional tetrahydrofolate synthase/dihydrofolate synthase [Rhodanobacteraceae bacterium]
MQRTLSDWLDYQQRTHARGIDLGLDRVRDVWRRVGAPPIARTVITIGGTNGKGSTVAFLEAMLRAGGMRVGAYTSPHILRYNERIRINGIDAEDEALVAAFERIETARSAGPGEPVPLTYFEFGTLAAFDLFARAGLDVALLEVGLGGRLDAVNLVDADAAIVTTVDLDHMEWLGDDRESIGREKAGIFRFDRPAIIGESDPPQSLVSEAHRIGARALRAGRDFVVHIQHDHWNWRSGDTALDLPMPELSAPSQFANAAAAVAALHALRDRLPWNPQALARGVREARVAGRLQRIAESPQVIVDVAHNPQAARELARWLQANPISGNNVAVFGALGDKDVESVVRALHGRFAHWFLAGLEHDSPRGLPVAELARRVRGALPETSFSEHADVDAALQAARTRAKPQDRILVFGSFFMVAAAMR